MDPASVDVVRVSVAALSDRVKVFVAGGVGGEPAVVSDLEGNPFDAQEVLEGSDMAVLVASADDSVQSAVSLGRLCQSMGVTVAGVIVGDQDDPPRAVLAELRRFSHLVLVSAGADDLGEVLLALRV